MMNPKVRLAAEFLNKNLHRDLTLDDICEVAELKHSRLCELFQNEFRMPPLQYHKELRLKRACERLENSLDKVEAIIIELGFDRSGFFRDFKLHTGHTPSEYRARHIHARMKIRKSAKSVRETSCRRIRHEAGVIATTFRLPHKI